MQEDFFKDEQIINALCKTISEPRLARYLDMGNGDKISAIKLYHWNALLSQSLYFPLQMWEVSLRNKLNYFLIWKFNKAWPYNDRCRRQLSGAETRRLDEVKIRQSQLRGINPVPTDPIVADLSSGFWAALLTAKYDVPFVWRYNLPRIFPNEAGITRHAASEICDNLVDLRNRIAHHEAILHLDLPARWAELYRLLNAMCGGAHHYAMSGCTFQDLWAHRPI
jgi:hypothetical protein